jgi:hypothetical protein
MVQGVEDRSNSVSEMTSGAREQPAERRPEPETRQACWAGNRPERDDAASCGLLRAALIQRTLMHVMSGRV